MKNSDCDSKAKSMLQSVNISSDQLEENDTDINSPNRVPKQSDSSSQFDENDINKPSSLPSSQRQGRLVSSSEAPSKL